MKKKVVGKLLNLINRIIEHKKNQDLSRVEELLNKNDNEDIIFFCMGTDRVVGDSIGPLIGSLLSSKYPSLNVYGTMEKPIHALNVERNIKDIKTKYPDSLIIAIDSCIVDHLDEVGTVDFDLGSISPGAGLNKKLGEIGDIAVRGGVATRRTCTFENLVLLDYYDVLKMSSEIMEKLEKYLNLKEAMCN